MSNEQQHQAGAADGASKHDQAEKIASNPSAAGADSVRERVRSLVVEAMKETNAGVARLQDVTAEVMSGAIEGSRGESAEQREQVLKEVIDGLSEGASIAANAARLTLDEARGRGESFAREDLVALTRDLQALEQMFVETVSNTINRVGEGLDGQRQDLIDHTRNTARQMRPSLESAAKAAARQPVMLAGDVASAGVKMGTMAVGRFTSALGGLLQTAGGRLADTPRAGATGAATTPPPTAEGGSGSGSGAGSVADAAKQASQQHPHPQAPGGKSPIPEEPQVSNTSIPEDNRHIPPNAEQDRRAAD